MKLKKLIPAKSHAAILCLFLIGILLQGCAALDKSTFKNSFKVITTHNILCGETVEFISLQGVGEFADFKYVSYKVDNPEVVEIVGNNKLHAVGIGKATITVKYDHTEVERILVSVNPTFQVTIQTGEEINLDRLTKVSGWAVPDESKKIVTVVGYNFYGLSAGEAYIKSRDYQGILTVKDGPLKELFSIEALENDLQGYKCISQNEDKKEVERKYSPFDKAKSVTWYRGINSQLCYFLIETGASSNDVLSWLLKTCVLPQDLRSFPTRAGKGLFYTKKGIIEPVSNSWSTLKYTPNSHGHYDVLTYTINSGYGTTYKYDDTKFELTIGSYTAGYEMYINGGQNTQMEILGCGDIVTIDREKILLSNYNEFQDHPRKYNVLFMATENPKETGWVQNWVGSEPFKVYKGYGYILKVVKRSETTYFVLNPSFSNARWTISLQRLNSIEDAFKK